MTSETQPGGVDGDNLTKTKLSTGEMSDVFLYNPGSLFQALNPDTNLQPLTDQPWVSQMTPQMKAVVSTTKGTYGAPIGTTSSGGVLYNKKVYADLGLKVPTSWAEFRSNNEKIKAAGKVTPIYQSYASAFTWTAQLFVLGDFANVAAQDPNFAANYTAGKAKYVDQPALQGFVNQQQAHDDGFFNKDYASATFDSALKAIANGTAAHYPMLTGALSTIVAELPGQDQRRRLLRAAGPGRGEHQGDHLAAQRPLHPEDDHGRQAGRGQEVPGLGQLQLGLRGPEQGRPRSPARTRSAPARCPTRCRRP